MAAAAVHRIQQAAGPARRRGRARPAHGPSGICIERNVKLLRAVDRTISEVIPQDPSRAEYRLGNTPGRGYRHWWRARIGRRFRLFFRYDARANVIVYAWINDECTLRSSGSRTDPCAVFAKMLARGNPPDDWAALMAASGQESTAER